MRTVLALALGVILVTGATGQDACSPDALCAGDPCVVGSAALETPCSLDFGPRALVVRGTIQVEDGGGQLSLTAGSILVEGRLVAIRQGRCAPIHLNAAAGIQVTGSVRSCWRDDEPTVVLDAGGDILLDGPIDVRGFIRGGHIVANAGGHISSTKALNVSATPGVNGPIGSSYAGNITLDAGGDITLAGPVRGTTKSFGGAVTLSADGTVVVMRLLNFRSGSEGARVLVTARAGVVVDAVIDVRSRYGNGDVRIAATEGSIDLGGSLLADALGRVGGGGTVEATAFGDLVARGRITCGAGCIALKAGGALDTLGASIDAPLVSDCPGP